MHCTALTNSILAVSETMGVRGTLRWRSRSTDTFVADDFFKKVLSEIQFQYRLKRHYEVWKWSSATKHFWLQNNGWIGPHYNFSSDTARRANASSSNINPYPTAFPYGNGMVLHFYQQQESSTTKTVHKVINKGLKAYVYRDRRFATLQRTLFIYLINKYISLSDICLTVHHWYK